MSDHYWTAEEDAAFRAAADGNPYADGQRRGEDHTTSVSLVSLEVFAAVHERGVDALVGVEDAVLIPEGGDVVIYGDGGAGKTTLSIDLACHLAAGQDWLGIHVARRVRVLLIENEGPRPLFRRKLRRKLDAWAGPALNGHISVFDSPWAEFSFAIDNLRAALAAVASEHQIDVLIIGPVTRSGMDHAGTLQEVRDFMALVGDVRASSRRPLTVVLIHHENKAGTVSGAWEGASDTLLHVEARGNGYTRLHIQKARWSSIHHNTTLELAWTPGEGFTTKDERDLGAEIETLLGDRVWRTAKEIAAPKDKLKPGVGANIDHVKEWLNTHPDRVTSRTGDDAKEVERSATATVWQLTPTAKSPEPPADSSRDGEEQVTPDFPLRKSGLPEPPHLHVLNLAQTTESPPSNQTPGSDARDTDRREAA